MEHPTELVQAINLNMKASLFAEQIAKSGLAEIKRSLNPLQQSKPKPDTAIRGHQKLALDQQELSFHYSLDTARHKLTYYELAGNLQFTKFNYQIYATLYQELLPILATQYSPRHEVVALRSYEQLCRIPMPSDGYPTDRYVVGRMTPWDSGKRKVSLSFARIPGEQMFFQLRAIYL